MDKFDTPCYTPTPISTPCFCELHSTPIYDEPRENDSIYHLRLCLCPLCKNGIKVFGEKRPVSWIMICRVILYSLMETNKGKVYFSLKDDIHSFVFDHWYIFGELDQFKTNQNRWKKAFLDGLSHSPYFQSGTMTLKKPNYWKLRRKDCPWIKQRKFYNLEDDDVMERGYDEINQSVLPASLESSPSPESNDLPTRDRSKEYLQQSIELMRLQMEKCRIVCGNLAKEDCIAPNMNDIGTQFGYLQNSLQMISNSMNNLIF